MLTDLICYCYLRIIIYSFKICTSRSSSQKLVQQQNCSILGKVITFALQTSQYAVLNAALTALRKDAAPDEQEVLKFFRIEFKKNVFFSAEYTRVRARNSYTVEFVDEVGVMKIGAILYYIKVSTVVFAVIKELVPVFNVSEHFNIPSDCLDRLHCSTIEIFSH